MSSSLRILVIDDDPVMRELLEALLGYAGHHVETVDSGNLALSRLSQADCTFDIVLTDLHMPGLQGKELAERLHQSCPPDTLLIGMSGSSPTDDEIHLLDEFLQKPFTPGQFEQAIARAQASTKAAPPATAAPTLRTDVEPVLDETIFSRLAGMMPADQLLGLYTLTLDDVLSRLELMKTSAAAGDFDAVHREAHAIKGGCGMVGARELHVLAAHAEIDTSTNFDKFTLACDRLKRMLDERLSS